MTATATVLLVSRASRAAAAAGSKASEQTSKLVRVKTFSRTLATSRAAWTPPYSPTLKTSASSSRRSCSAGRARRSRASSHRPSASRSCQSGRAPRVRTSAAARRPVVLFRGVDDAVVVLVAAAAQIDDVVVVTGRDRGVARKYEPHFFAQAEHIRQPRTNGHIIAVDAREAATDQLSRVTSVFCRAGALGPWLVLGRNAFISRSQAASLCGDLSALEPGSAGTSRLPVIASCD